MRELTLQAEVRTQKGKHTRALRRDGNIPGVFYIHGEENIPITVAEKSLKPLIYTSETHIVNLKLNTGNDKNCILRAIQFDPVTDRPIHFDLQGLRENEEITLEVPITITGGTPVGVRDGGVLQQVIHRLKISCLPKHIPDHIEVNVAELKINHFVHVRDLKVENIAILENENSSIVGVVPPTIEKEPTPGTPVAEEAVEPEVIGKGKKPEEGAEGEAAEKKPEVPTKAAAPAKEEKK
ncbi:MAG: 50S ribosomal protein L25 [Ignavibacteria bacterium]|nr:50S ribosomal protein L25 [Ignavibacteria bacterium]